MPAVRQDLLELGIEALTAQANAGFVKRAQKELAAGPPPELKVDEDGSIHAHFSEGVHTRLPPGKTLADAQCNCSAPAMCRHRVMLVLAYQAAQTQPATAGASAQTQQLPQEQTVPATPAAQAHGDTCAAQSTAAPAERWSPAHFDDEALLQAFGPRAVEQARKYLVQRPLIHLQAAPGLSPSAQLPLAAVRFFSPSNPAQMHCDIQGPARHAFAVLAVWAFRKAERIQPGQTQWQLSLEEADAPAAPLAATPANHTPQTASPTAAPLPACAPAALQTRFDALMRSLWIDGCQQHPQALQARFGAIAQELHSLGWRWMEQALEQLHTQILAQQQRDSRYSPQALLQAWAHCQARWLAAQHALAHTTTASLPAAHILGLGVPGEEALAKLRLISLGAQLWHSDQAQGVTVHLADPDTQSLMVLEHTWPLPATPATHASAAPTPAPIPTPVPTSAPAPLPALAQRRLAGMPLHQIAGGQIITDQAKRQASGRITLMANSRRSSVMPLSASAWDLLRPPIRFSTLAALAAHLADTPPAFITPRPQAHSHSGSLHIVDCQHLGAPQTQWDGAEQCLWLQWPPEQITEDRPEAPAPAPAWQLLARLPYQHIAPAAIDTLLALADGAWGPITAVSGLIHRQGHTLHLLPLAVLTAQRGVSLCTDTHAAPTGHTPHHPAEGNAQAASPTHTALAQALDLLAWALNEGLRQLGHTASHAFTEMAQRLHALGYPEAAHALQRIPGYLQQRHAEPLCRDAATLVLLLHQLQAHASPEITNQYE